MKKRIIYIALTLFVVAGLGLGLGLYFGLKEEPQSEKPFQPTLLESGLYNADGLVENWESLTTGEAPAIQTDGNKIVDCDQNLAGELVLSNNIEVIGVDAFLSCQQLTKITLPSTIKEIAKDAFYNCIELTEVVIPSDAALTTIGYGAFTYCHKLTTLAIPSTVTKVGESAFLGCTLLDHIVLPASITKIEAALFKDCESLSDLTYGDIDEIGSQAFYNCRSLTQFDFKNTTKIGFSAFWNCKSLERADLPATLDVIGNHGFTRCSALTTVTFGNDATTLGMGCFEDCIRLTTIELPTRLNLIPENCFFGCEALTSLTMGEHIIKIERYAFKNCKNLTIDFAAYGSWGYLEGEQMVPFELCGESGAANRLELIEGKDDKVFEIMKYTISFDLQGYGTEIAPRKGSYLPDTLPTPTDETMAFAGWYLDADCTILAEAGAIILEDTVLYAKWDRI